MEHCDQYMRCYFLTLFVYRPRSNPYFVQHELSHRCCRDPAIAFHFTGTSGFTHEVLDEVKDEVDDKVREKVETPSKVKSNTKSKIELKTKLEMAVAMFGDVRRCSSVFAAPTDAGRSRGAQPDC